MKINETIVMLVFLTVSYTYWPKLSCCTMWNYLWQMEVIGELWLGLVLVILEDWTIGWWLLYLHVDLLFHFYCSCPAVGVGSAAVIYLLYLIKLLSHF